VQILMLAREIGLLKLGKVSLDGTKVKANASKHHALSWNHACKLEQLLQAEVQELMRLAEKADSEETSDGMNIPEELSRRHDRLAAITKAKEKIDLAVAHFEKAVRLKPDYSLAKNNLGSAYLVRKEWDKAIIVLEEVTGDMLYATPHFPLANLGWAYYNKKN